MVSKIGIISTMVTQTPSRHFSLADPVLFVSMLNIHVLKMESSMIKKMQREVVRGDRARVDA